MPPSISTAALVAAAALPLATATSGDASAKAGAADNNGAPAVSKSNPCACRFKKLRLSIRFSCLQHFTLETVACRQAKPALLLFRGKDLPRKSLQSSSLIIIRELLYALHPARLHVAVVRPSVSVLEPAGCTTAFNA
jgi:hypothetical protein